MNNNVIPLSRPAIRDADIRAVTDVLRSGRLSLGPATERFEELLAARIGRSEGVAVSSGTAGLHRVLEALGAGPGDEVITPAFSFVARQLRRARRSHSDLRRLRSTHAHECIGCRIAHHRANQGDHRRRGLRQPRGHTAGRVAGQTRDPLVEDACKGSADDLATIPSAPGRAAVFAFYPNKQITTGEGGMIVTDDQRLADACRSMRKGDGW